MDKDNTRPCRWTEQGQSTRLLDEYKLQSGYGEGLRDLSQLLREVLIVIFMFVIDCQEPHSAFPLLHCSSTRHVPIWTLALGAYLRLPIEPLSRHPYMATPGALESLDRYLRHDAHICTLKYMILWYSQMTGRNHNIYSKGIYLLGIGYDNDR